MAAIETPLACAVVIGIESEARVLTIQIAALNTVPEHQQIAALNQQGDLAAAAQLLNGASDKQFLALKAQIQKLITINHEDAEAASAEGDRLYADAQLYIWSLIALSLLIVALAT